jgi:uncharacterized protein (TIGR04255 family)
MPRTYQKPPLVEAVAEFQFVPTQPWDWTVPGRFYDLIKATFPTKRTQNVMELSLHPEEGRVRQELKSGVARMQFLTLDEKAIVQTGPDSLVFNQLAPYRGWHAFKETILNHLRSYVELTAPAGLKLASLRYIDRIEITGVSPLKLSEYFVNPPRGPEGIPDNIAAFATELDTLYTDPAMTMRFILSSIPPSIIGPSLFPVPEPRSGVLNFLADIGVWSPNASAPTVAGTDAWLEAAHSRLESMFDASFTAKMHSEVFGETAR